MSHVQKEAHSIRRLRAFGVVTFAVIACLLAAQALVLGTIHKKQDVAESLTVLADEQLAELTALGRTSQAILSLRTGFRDTVLVALERSSIKERIVSIRERERRLEHLAASLSDWDPLLAYKASEHETYDAVLDSLLSRAAELASDNAVPAISTWALPDLATAPHGVLVMTLNALKVDAHDAADRWRTAGIQFGHFSIAAVTLLLALLVFGLFRPLCARALRDYLALQDSLSVRTRYFYQMSHELRTPLNAISGYTELILQSAQASGDRRSAEFGRLVLQASRQLSHRVGDILLFAEIQSGAYPNSPVRIDLAGILQSAVSAACPSPVGGPTIEMIDDRRRPETVRTDQAALTTILIQLLRNARRHAGQRCLVRLRDGGILEVCDDGPGIDRTDIARLVRPFQTANNASMVADNGPGLGLAIVTQLAALNDIAIDVRREGEFATVFRLVVPLADGEPAEFRNRTAGLPAGAESQIRCAS